MECLSVWRSASKLIPDACSTTSAFCHPSLIKHVYLEQQWEQSTLQILGIQHKIFVYWLFLSMQEPIWGGGGCGLSFGLPGGSEGKEFACSAGDLGSIPGLGRSPTPEDPPGERNGYPLQCSCLENSMVRGAWPQRVGHSLVTLYVSPSLSHTHTPLSSKPLVAENFTVQFMSWKRRE